MHTIPLPRTDALDTSNGSTLQPGDSEHGPAPAQRGGHHPHQAQAVRLTPRKEALRCFGRHELEALS